jgi:hypothetical protein
VIYGLALDQHGRVARWQLLERGVPDGAIQRRVEREMLQPVRRGIYALGAPKKSWNAALASAALAGGAGAVISHESAAVVHRIRRRHVRRVHVTVSHPGGHSAPDLRLHHARHLEPADVEIVAGIPVTRLERTLLDLAEISSVRALGRVVHELDVERRLDLEAIDAMVVRNPGRHGIRTLRTVLDKHRPREKAAIQERLYRLALQAGFEATEQNQRRRVDGIAYELDIFWETLGLCLEADGYAVHGTARRFWSDRSKDRKLWLAGIVVHRYTWEDVTRRRAQTLAELGRIRERAGGPG